MAPTYATYEIATASRFVRFRRKGQYVYIAVFDPPTISPVDATVFSGPRPVAIHEQGGARRKTPDWSIGGNGTAQMLTDELGAYVCIVGITQGAVDDQQYEEIDEIFSPESHLESALAVMFLRGNRTNRAVVGNVFTMQYDPRYWLYWGDSAGTWHGLFAQLIPVGDLSDLADELAARGDQYVYDHDHRVGHFYAFEGQNRLSDFCEYESDPALDPFGTPLPSTYTCNGVQAAGATALVIQADTVKINRANRLQLTTTSSYITVGTHSPGVTAVNVSTGTPPIPAGTYISFAAGDVDEHLVSADYAGGTGAIQIVGNALTGTVNAGTAINVRFNYAVTTDFAGGAGSVSIWPSVQFPIASATAVVVEHPAAEALGVNRQSWAGGYFFGADSGFIWRSDDTNGRGFPIQRKRQGDVDWLVHSRNPRVRELNLMIVSPTGTSLQRVDSLTHERSFWLRRNKTALLPVSSYVTPEYIDLHDEGGMALLAHEVYLRSNANVQAYLGDRRSNPSGTVSALPWLKGRRTSFTDQTLKAYLIDPARQGGAFI